MSNYLLKYNLYNLPDIKSELMNYYNKITLSHYEKFLNSYEEDKYQFLHAANKDDDLNDIINFANDILAKDQNGNFDKGIGKKFDKIIFLGTGGSSLSGKLFYDNKKNDSEIEFIESIDDNILLNLKKNISNKILYIIISKSGNTIETICQLLLIIQEFYLKYGNIDNYNFAFVTEDNEQNNLIYDIAKNIKSKIYFHPKKIGGRFSYLSVTGLLPAYLSGLDIYKIRKSSSAMLDYFTKENDIYHNEILKILSYQLFLFNNGYNNHIIMPYNNLLYNFAYWYRQLLSESLGKNSFNINPEISFGTIDQHSKLQLYIDGCRNKFFTFLFKDNKVNRNADDSLFLDKKILNSLNIDNIFLNKDVNHILNIEQETTRNILKDKSLPIREFIFKDINEELLSSLMMQFCLETIMIGWAYNIDIFSQDDIEIRKKNSLNIISKI